AEDHQIVCFRVGLLQRLGGRSVLRALHADVPFRATGSLLACIDFMRSAADAPSSDSPFEAAIGSEGVSLQCCHSMLLSSLRPQHAWIFARIRLLLARGGRCSVCCWRGGVWRNTARRRRACAEIPRPRSTCPTSVR